MIVFDGLELSGAVPGLQAQRTMVCRQVVVLSVDESGIDVFNDGFCNYGEKWEES